MALPPKQAQPLVDDSGRMDRAWYLWATQQTSAGPATRFADLPTRPGVGQVQVIGDSTVNTWGATVTGGGASTVLAWYTGAHWSVIGA
jgi:hypothetical protein